MRFSQLCPSLALTILLCLSEVRGDSAFDCKPSVNGKTYDLEFLSGYQTIESSIATPPTTTRTTYQVALCAPIPRNGDLSDKDQCPAGTRVCMVVTNAREGEKDRIISVVPLAGEISHGNLEARTSLGTSSDSSKPPPLVIKFKGGHYSGRDQSAEITLVCDQDAKEIKTIDHHYSSSEGLFKVTFASNHICSTDSGDNNSPSPQDPTIPPTKPHSGWGFFATLFFFAFIALVGYFAIGIYIQRTQYNATGWDLIPHKDFFRDIPYLVRDLIGSRNRATGYSAI